MLIICCGMKRSGSTVQYQITGEIVEVLGKGKMIGFTDSQRFGNQFKDYKNHSEYLVVKSHEYLKSARSLLDQEETRAIYIYRDLRDVVVSLLNKGNRKFYRLMLSGEIEEIIETDRLWCSTRNILISRYEEMMPDLSEEVRRISAYLSFQLEEQQIIQIANKYSLENQVTRIKEFDYKKFGFKTQKNKKTRVNPENLLHENHINSGAAEQWKFKLTPIQVGIIECFAYDWFIQHDYKISQVWVNKVTVTIMALFKRLSPLIRKIYKLFST